MPTNGNALQWHGQHGHYEVYYLTATDPRSGVGLWIRYTMLAPDRGTPTCALWFVATDPRPGHPTKVARKQTLPIDLLHLRPEPFELRLGEAWLTNEGMGGAFEDVEWELRWTSSAGSYEHVHPLLRRSGLAQTILVLPWADLSITGLVKVAGDGLELKHARGAQAHLWGSKHASQWAWAHCSDFTTLGGEPASDVFIDGVSVLVRRLGRPMGPSTPIVGRIRGQDFMSTSPVHVISNRSRFGPYEWRFEARDRRRKLVGEVEVDRELLAGVTYQDPDGELAYCYNSETASMRLHLYERAPRTWSWSHRETLVAPGRAHFEYAQRSPVADLDLLLR